MCTQESEMRTYYVYICSNKYRTVFYTGVTNNLNKRIASHAAGEGSKFTSRYNCTDLIYYEEFRDIRQAISREKQLKNWKRQWKLDLVKSINPELKKLL